MHEGGPEAIQSWRTKDVCGECASPSCRAREKRSGSWKGEAGGRAEELDGNCSLPFLQFLLPSSLHTRGHTMYVPVKTWDSLGLRKHGVWKEETVRSWNPPSRGGAHASHDGRSRWGQVAPSGEASEQASQSAGRGHISPAAFKELCLRVLV